MSTLAVVIPTQGRRAALDTGLARLSAQRDAGAFEVLLAADATVTDRGGLTRRLGDAGLAGRVVRAERPGASAARNAGWRAASADVILFLDDDVWPGPGLVAAHRAVHEAEPDLGVGAVGRLRWAPGRHVSPFMRWVEQGLAFDTGGLAAAERAGAGTGWWHLYTCNCSLKRGALARVGGLDAAGFPFGYEDLDLGRRLDAALPGGLRLRVPAAASAEHDQAMTLAEWETRVERIARGERRFVARHPEVPPHFHDRFAPAANATSPAPRGRAARLAPYVPPWVPGLGPRIEESSRVFYERRLADRFLDAWEAACDEDPGPPPQPE